MSKKTDFEEMVEIEEDKSRLEWYENWKKGNFNSERQ